MSAFGVNYCEKMGGDADQLTCKLLPIPPTCTGTIFIVILLKTRRCWMSNFVSRIADVAYNFIFQKKEESI